MKKIYLFSSVFFLSLSLCACNNTNTTVTRLQILQNPNKLEYITGELFDPTGLVLGVQFADGKTSKIRFCNSDRTTECRKIHTDEPPHRSEDRHNLQ